MYRQVIRMSFKDNVNKIQFSTYKRLSSLNDKKCLSFCL
jgi:hypothetical protein